RPGRGGATGPRLGLREGPQPVEVLGVARPGIGEGLEVGVPEVRRGQHEQRTRAGGDRAVEHPADVVAQVRLGQPDEGHHVRPSG
ncbi:MAG: hypothetical protein ACK559_33205, partial [bacterium]